MDIIVIAFAPALFTSIYATIKTFLDPVTASKVKVFGTSRHEKDKMRQALRSFIDPAVPPKEYGGDSDVEVGYPSGYKGEKYPIHF